VYSNITIRPPNFVLEDPRWPLTWTSVERTRFYELARHAIGYGVVSAWTEAAADFPVNIGNIPYKNNAGAPPGDAINAGLSNISARSARLTPHWSHRPDPKDDRDIKYLNLRPGPPDPQNRYWIDRARIFQSAMARLGVEHGTVDSAINDLTPEASLTDTVDPRDPKNYPGKPINYCERQGRCNVGCLPGARHTLNKQLMMASYGKFDGTPPTFVNFFLEALAEVNVIRPLPEGGYAVDYWQRSEANPSQKTEKTLRSKYVVVSAGCLGTNEIMQRSSVRHGGMLHLSPKLGFGFSTNGDYIAFAENLDFKVGLSRGPVTTSFAHFNSTESDSKSDASKFHILEDQGIPRALASTVGFGLPLIHSLSNGRHRQPKLLLIWTIILWLWHRVASLIVSLFRNAQERQRDFESEDELTYNMMCVVGAGREESIGQFRLGESRRDSPLRVRRTDGKPFHRDPIFKEIESSLRRLADTLPSKEPFRNPFLSSATGELVGKSVTVSHPLGGCPMGKSADSGVVDEYGRVFKAQPKTGEPPFYEGLYVVDGAIIPTALGVNPSLTISALALRIANRLSQELASKL
jgi:cholesterol oxidase